MSSLVANLFRQPIRDDSVRRRQTIASFMTGQGNRALVCFPPEKLALLQPAVGQDTVETERSDIYGLGVIVWQLFFGPFPEHVLRDAFGTNGERLNSQSARTIQRHMRTELRGKELPPALAEIIRNMIEEDSRSRPTSAQVCEQLSQNYSAFVAQWLRGTDRTPYLLGVMSKKSDHTVGAWKWTAHKPSTPVGRRQLLDLVAEEAKGARLVYSETGFTGRDIGVVSEEAGDAKYIILGKKGAWFCAPYFRTGTRQTLDQILNVRFVIPKERATDLYDAEWSQHLPPCEVIDVETMVTETILAKREGRPSWTNTLSASQPPEDHCVHDRIFLDALEWLLTFQQVELQAREYAFVKEWDDGAFALLRFDQERDQHREEGGASRLFAFYSNLKGTRPTFAPFFSSDALREQSPQLEVAADYNGRPNRSTTRIVTIQAQERDDAFTVKRERENDPIPVRGWIRPQADIGTEIALLRQRTAYDEIRVLPGLIDQLTTPEAIQGFSHYWDQALEGLSDEGSVDGRPIGAKARLLEMLTLQPLYALLGPPGTGKTELVARNIAAYLAHDRAARILVSAQSNYATDNLFERLIQLITASSSSIGAENRPIMFRATSRDFDPKKISKPVQEHTLDKVAAQVTESIRRHCQNQMRELGGELQTIVQDWLSRLDKSKLEIRERIRRSANVVFATCSGATKQNVSSGRQFGYFDWVFVEEAAKAWPTEIIIPLVRGFRWTLVGDHKQLPAHRRREVEDFLRKCARSIDPEINAHGKRADEYVKIFDLFANLFEGFNQSENNTPPPGELVRPVGKLQRQFRMREDICTLVNTFYEDPLETHSAAERPTLIEHPAWTRGSAVVWLDTDGFPDCKASGMWQNRGEAKLLLKVLDSLKPFPDKLLYASEKRYKDPLAIITPYNQQKRLITSEILGSKFKRILDLDQILHNVHTIQGREAEVVIASLVRTNTEGETETERIGYLATDSIINVLLSRARRLLIIIGHFETFFESRGFETSGSSEETVSNRPKDRFWSQICSTVLRKRCIVKATTVFDAAEHE
ncbi:MAG TPA: AAA domain-containing protein [Pyrinomonadaceae bacterium]|nr:AAA domain-containing protein [Pyrinomonadaceae bacterium]